MERVRRTLEGQKGVVTPVLALFLTVAVLFAFLAWSFISTVDNDRSVLKAALDLALTAATAKGAGVAEPGVIRWDGALALQAAAQAVAFDLPVTLSSVGDGGATFDPTSRAPANWVGSVALEDFRTSDLGVSRLCPNASGQTSAEPYVTARLLLPIGFTFMGRTFAYTVKACDVDMISTYNGRQFR